MSLLVPPSAPPPRYHALTVSGVRHPVPGSVVLTFEVPDSLRSTCLRFRAGQYVTLRAVVKGEEVRQSYSIYLSPAQALATQTLQIAASEVPGGRMSPWLVHEVRVGDVIEVLPPMGDFVLADHSGVGERHVAIAGGSGVTPVMSVVTDLLERDARHRITVILSHRDPLCAIGLADLLDLESRCPRDLTVRPIWTRAAPAGESVAGRLTRERLAELIGVDGMTGAIAGGGQGPIASAADHWWVCGPAGLVTAVEGWLRSDGVEPANLHTEVFTAAAEPT
ncbi:FAD-binding oxidoreductase [Janibacter sp. GXQ6167]|uniref:FAD-binding oxidoreductase n=1 Tax=Janibacter sp. GXQ6167 TaxID=3240791 RepID=UPI0035261FEF